MPPRLTPWLTEETEDICADLVHLAYQVHHVYHGDQIFVSTWQDCTFTVCRTCRDCTARLAALAAPSHNHDQPTAEEHDHDDC